MIRAVILDIGGVVASFVPGSDLDATWEKRLGIPAGSIAQRVWSHPMQSAAELGEVTVEDYWGEVASILGLEGGTAREFYEDCWSITRLDDRVRAWITSLRPRYVVATLSNSWSDGRRECTKRMGLDLLVDLMVFSAEEGVAKPDPEVYRRTLARIGVTPHEAVFIDDRSDNVGAAQALGMHAFQSTDPEHLLREAPRVLERLG